MLADFASELLKKFPKFATKNDDVLMAIAKTFPIGDYGQTYKLPSGMHRFCSILTIICAFCLPATTLTGALEGKSSLIKRIVLVPVLLLDVILFLFGLILVPILLSLVAGMHRFCSILTIICAFCLPATTLTGALEGKPSLIKRVYFKSAKFK
ncbi:hypothetical protein Tco_1513777 [Tanacetum coccineum]